MPTLFTSMKRTFSSKPARELFTDPQSSGGSYRLTSSADLIAYHRKLKLGNRWPARVHLVITIALVLSLLAILLSIYLSLLYSGRSDSARAEGCFTVAIWASVGFTCLVLAKCWANSRFPQS